MNKEEKKINEFQLKWFDITLEEYKSLRKESGEALKQQQSIINYGLTAIGVLIAFSANLWGKEMIVESIYVFFVPFMCNLIILIWNGEVRRMSRAGKYIKVIEDKVHMELSARSHISKPALNWETFLRNPQHGEVRESQDIPNRKRKASFIKGMFLKPTKGKDNKIKSNYIAIIIMFAGLSLLSILLGFGHNFSMFKQASQLEGQVLWTSWISNGMWLLMAYAIIFIIDLLYFIYHYRYFQKVKN